MSYHHALLLALVLVAPSTDAGPSSPKERAVALIAPVAARDGFTLRRAWCKPWKGRAQICELCYSHPKHYLGWARVWCNATRCEWVLDPSDPRMRGAHFGNECAF